VGKSGANPVEYSWDAANRLREVSSSSSRVSFEYDGDGNKVHETMRPRAGGAVETVDYLNDVSGPLPVVLQSDFERDGNPVKQVRFHYGPSRIQQEIVRDGRVTDEFFFHPAPSSSTRCSPMTWSTPSASSRCRSCSAAARNCSPTARRRMRSS
jgi:YD repeat-containing protein